jgi:hypothetical protein
VEEVDEGEDPDAALEGGEGDLFRGLGPGGEAMGSAEDEAGEEE